MAIQVAAHERQALGELKAVLERDIDPVEIRLFGSAARGEAADESDLDVMILVRDRTPAVERTIDDLVFRINLRYGCLISTVIYGVSEINDGPMSESPLYKAAEREGVAL